MSAEACSLAMAPEKDPRPKCLSCSSFDAVKKCETCSKFVCAGCIGENEKSEGWCPGCEGEKSMNRGRVRDDLITFKHPVTEKEMTRLIKNLAAEEIELVCPRDEGLLIQPDGINYALQCEECDRKYRYVDIQSAPGLYVITTAALPELKVVFAGTGFVVHHGGQIRRAATKIAQHYEIRCNLCEGKMFMQKIPGVMGRPFVCEVCENVKPEKKVIEQYEEEFTRKHLINVSFARNVVKHFKPDALECPNCGDVMEYAMDARDFSASCIKCAITFNPLQFAIQLLEREDKFNLVCQKGGDRYKYDPVSHNFICSGYCDSPPISFQDMIQSVINSLRKTKEGALPPVRPLIVFPISESEGPILVTKISPPSKE